MQSGRSARKTIRTTATSTSVSVHESGPREKLLHAATLSVSIIPVCSCRERVGGVRGQVRPRKGFYKAAFRIRKTGVYRTLTAK